MKVQLGPHMIGSWKETQSGKSLFTVYRVDIMGPRVDLVLSVKEQIIGKQKSQFTVSPVDLEGPLIDWVHCRHFNKHLAGGVFHGVASRPGKLGQVPHDHFLLPAEGKFPVCPIDILGDQVHMKSIFIWFCPHSFFSKPYQMNSRSSPITSIHQTHLPHHDLITNGPLIFQMGDSHPSMAKYT